MATVSFQAAAYEKILAYECQSTARVGFIYDPAQGWIPNMEKLKVVKYKIFSTPTRGNRKYGVQMGDEATLSDLGCDDFSPNGILDCDVGLGGRFRFHKENLRFIHSFDNAYFNVGARNATFIPINPPTDAESLRPTQQIGTCVKIN